jgi:hypothetical protein
MKFFERNKKSHYIPGGMMTSEAIKFILYLRAWGGARVHHKPKLRARTHTLCSNRVPACFCGGTAGLICISKTSWD